MLSSSGWGFLSMNRTSPMFENPIFLADLILSGLNTLAAEGRLNAPEVYSYVFDKTHELDAKLIAEAVREFNQKGEK